MKNIITLLISVMFTLQTYCQKSEINAIGISLPIIWNNSEGIYYALGNKIKPTGNAISYGININYARSIFKYFFVTLGIGYYNQSFGIKRPFEFIAPDSTKPLVFSNKYSYENLHLIIGLGYRKTINRNLSINSSLTFNSYNSFKQNYKQSYISNYDLINHKKIQLGKTINLNFEIDKKLDNHLSVCAGLSLPILNKWKNDQIFHKYDYSQNTQLIANNRFSIGGVLSIKYNLSQLNKQL